MQECIQQKKHNQEIAYIYYPWGEDDEESIIILTWICKFKE